MYWIPLLFPLFSHRGHRSDKFCFSGPELSLKNHSLLEFGLCNHSRIFIYVETLIPFARNGCISKRVDHCRHTYFGYMFLAFVWNVLIRHLSATYFLFWLMKIDWLIDWEREGESIKPNRSKYTLLLCCGCQWNWNWLKIVSKNNV